MKATLIDGQKTTDHYLMEKTTLSVSSLAQIQKPLKIYNLSHASDVYIEDTALRSERLSPLNKPRSISREMSDDALVDEPEQSCLREFDLSQEAVFDIATLKPLETKQFSNLEATPYSFETPFDVLSWASAFLTESPLALSLLRHARETGWKLALNDLGTGGFHLDSAEKIIELDDFGLDYKSLGQSSYFRLSLLCILAKALREIWHENEWGAFEGKYKPEAVLLLERARAADADAVSVIIGWELRGAGYNDIWRHILGSEEGDMAQVLTNLLERYPTALYNGMAMAHVFRQWYADLARVDALDYMTLEQMDFIITEQIFELGDQQVVPEDFEKLSTLPDEICYLKELGETVSKDPFFNSINDPINQAHLFQIVYDSKVTYVSGIPFRDATLARKFLKAD
jgi:hypothetical protein